MASEDSDQVLPGFLVIHCLSDLRNLDQARHREMPTCGADLDAARKLLEVSPLRCTKRMLPKERDDDVEELVASANNESLQVLSVIVVAPIQRHRANLKEVAQLLEAPDATSALHHDEAVRHLIAGSVAAPPNPIGLLDEADREATFPIHETNYPTGPDQPFLLVCRTDRIVTAHSQRLGRVPDRFSGFPAYSRMLSVTLLPHRATCLRNLRTVIVTAAVYRGLASVLRGRSR